MELDKDNIAQAIVVMDTFNSNFKPLQKPLGLLAAAGVPVIDYVLESLAKGGVGETILFCCIDGNKIKEYIQKSIKNKSPWSLSMEVKVMCSDSCRSMGDVMREIDASGLIRGYFILMGVNTICNLPFATLLENHKQICKKDKGAAMTLLYKKVSWGHQLIGNDKNLFLVADANTHKVLLHKKYKKKSPEKKVSLPLETVLNHSEVKLHHNLADVNVAICSPSVPPLFADNFDFQTRDDFIHGILINEELLASSLYYVLLKDKYYAANISNWKTYKTICHDILHNWAYPLTIDTGSLYQDNYESRQLFTYCHKKSVLSRSCKLKEDVLIGENTQINDDTTIRKTFIGKNCHIGRNVTIIGSHIQNDVIIKDNCRIIDSYIDDGCEVAEGCVLENGCILDMGAKVAAGTILDSAIVEGSAETARQISATPSDSTEWENESSGSEVEDFIGLNKQWSDSESCYSSDSSDSSLPDSPVPDDTNIFLHEVIDSLARGYEEKLKCDYLILEINSSRYAYNIQLNEVNFFVVRALLSLPVLAESKLVLNTIRDVFKFFKPVLTNYIKSKSSIMDCLKAVEDSCTKCEWLDNKCGQILHLLYDYDVVDEDSLVDWFEDLKDGEGPLATQPSLVKFIEWLQQASEESD